VSLPSLQAPALVRSHAKRHADHPDLHPFPTRRSSDLPTEPLRPLTPKERTLLEEITHSRSERADRVARARALLALAAGATFTAEIGRAHAELQSPDHLVCRLLLEKKKPREQAGSGSVS